MEVTKGFYDMCIPFNKDQTVLRHVCKESVECKRNDLQTKIEIC